MLIGGKERDVRVNGSDPDYKTVRNLVVTSGRFLDASDVALRQKVALLTDKLAERLYGTRAGAVGQIIKVHGLQFTVIGTFKERVESFGQSELSQDTILIPFTVLRYFTPVERIDPMYVEVRSPQDVEAVTASVKQILEARHRPGASYHVENLTAILDAAKSIALVLSLVLVLVSAIALAISGIGIMNIMLVTVTERTREIGLRMAVGASRREILVAISYRGRAGEPVRRQHRYPGGRRHPFGRTGFCRQRTHPDLCYIHCDRLQRLDDGGAGFWPAAGQPRSPAQPDRSPAL